jgi:hypothetical protein
MLRRHLRIAHGLEVADYRTRWQLPLDFPLIAPSYSRGARRLPRRSGSGVTPPRNRARRPRAARGLAEPRSGSRPPPSAPVNELDGMRWRQNSPGQISVGARVRIGFAGHLTGPPATCPRTPVHVSTLPQPSAAARLVRSGQAPSDLN